jgi:hypothetical protein
LSLTPLGPPPRGMTPGPTENKPVISGLRVSWLSARLERAVWCSEMRFRFADTAYRHEPTLW